MIVLKLADALFRIAAYKPVEEAVFLYNTFRPHTALKYQTPEQVYKKVPDKFDFVRDLKQYL